MDFAHSKTGVVPNEKQVSANEIGAGSTDSEVTSDGI